MKLLIVGLDAADYKWCNEFMDVMPRLAKMKTEGVFGHLESHEFPSSPPCWFSAITGTTPEEHRIHGFRWKAMKDLRRPPFWEFIDCPIGIVNIPLVYYGGGEFDGFLVPGIHAPLKFYPPDLQLKDYTVEANKVARGQYTWLSDVKKMPPKEAEKKQRDFLAWQWEVESKRVDTIEDLLKKFDIDVLFVGLMLLDRIGHGFAHRKQIMRDAYGRADRLVGRLMDVARSETTVIFSDHGQDVRESPRVPGRKADEQWYKKSDMKIRVRGLHTQDGIFAAIGEYIKAGAMPQNAKLTDIAPTILAIMGKQQPRTMFGEVLDIFPEEEDPRTIAILKGLGYL